MELVVPALKYKESFLEALEEYQKEKVSPWDTRSDVRTLNPKILSKDFSFYMQQLQKAAIGKGLPIGYVHYTTYWLIDNDEFIGRVALRHFLTEKLLREGGHIGYDIRPSKRNQGYGKKILELALPKAKALGLSKVLITCDETNIASKKIIEENGGVFENSIDMGKGRPRKFRYWLTLS